MNERKTSGGAIDLTIHRPGLKGSDDRAQASPRVAVPENRFATNPAGAFRPGPTMQPVLDRLGAALEARKYSVFSGIS